MFFTSRQQPIFPILVLVVGIFMAPLLGVMAGPLNPEEIAPPSWLGWGGPGGDFRLPGVSGLVDDFGNKYPKRLWKRELGEGYAMVLAKDNRLYAHYSLGDEEYIAALNQSDGKTIWQRKYPVRYYDDMDRKYGKGPNATPHIMGNHLYTISIAGVLRCADLNDGRQLWHLDLHERYGRQKRKEEYGYSTSPVTYKEQLIVLIGGDQHAVVALNPENGKQVWGSPAARVSYAQPTKIRLDNRDQLVFFTPTEVIGLDLESGNFAWRHPVVCFTENNLTPALQLDERHLWVAAQLDGGSRVLKLPVAKGETKAEVVWESNTVKQAHWNSLVIGDYIYGSFGGNSTSYLAGLNWRTGKFAWRQRGFHLAKGVFADGKYFFTDENGQFVIARFSPTGVEILDAYQMLDRVSWTNPTMVGTTIYIRDKKHIISIDLKEDQPSQQ